MSDSSGGRKWLALSVQILKNEATDVQGRKIFRRYIQNRMSQKISIIAKP